MKLSGVFHVLFSTLTSLLQGNAVEVPDEVPLTTFEAAKSFYHTSHKMKMCFTQAVSLIAGHVLVPVREVEGIQAKVLKAVVRSKGPSITLRNLQKKLKNVNTEILKVELQQLQGEGFGFMQEGVRNSFTFFKPHPETISETTDLFKLHGIMYGEYNVNFRIMSDLTSAEKNLILNSHPHADLIMDILTPSNTSSDED